MPRDSTKIIKVSAFEFLDSRGNPTVAVEVITEGGGKGLFIVPSGASKGKREALELRDGDSRFGGKGVRKAIENIEKKIAPHILGMPADEQEKIDKILLDIDRTKNKSFLGANAILGVSIACAKAAADTFGLELYEYLGGKIARFLPVPLSNIINGGEHAGWNVDFQEYMIVPAGFDSFEEAIRSASEIFHTLKKIIVDDGNLPLVGDEGGFAPLFPDNVSPLELLLKATERAGYKPGEQILFALDIASSSFYDSKRKLYILRREKKELSTDEFIDYIISICSKYPIISVEDPLSEDDWEGWKKITPALKAKGIQVVGDDVFVTNPEIFSNGIREGIASAILVKVNQIGTLSETFQVINTAKVFGYSTIISHRSGDTEDTFIADLAVASNSCQIKTGSLSRSERTAKYNRLIYIEQKGNLTFPGKIAFRII
jgi:enolase